MSEIAKGARVRHAEWGDGIVLEVRDLLASRPATYRCQFEWTWGHRLRTCLAHELTALPSEAPAQAPKGAVTERDPAVA